MDISKLGFVVSICILGAVITCASAESGKVTLQSIKEDLQQISHRMTAFENTNADVLSEVKKMNGLLQRLVKTNSDISTPKVASNNADITRLVPQKQKEITPPGLTQATKRKSKMLKLIKLTQKYSKYSDQNLGSRHKAKNLIQSENAHSNPEATGNKSISRSVPKSMSNSPSLSSEERTRQPSRKSTPVQSPKWHKKDTDTGLHGTTESSIFGRENTSFPTNAVHVKGRYGYENDLSTDLPGNTSLQEAPVQLVVSSRRRLLTCTVRGGKFQQITREKGGIDSLAYDHINKRLYMGSSEKGLLESLGKDMTDAKIVLKVKGLDTFALDAIRQILYVYCKSGYLTIYKVEENGIKPQKKIKLRAIRSKKNHLMVDSYSREIYLIQEVGSRLRMSPMTYEGHIIRQMSTIGNGNGMVFDQEINRILTCDRHNNLVLLRSKALLMRKRTGRCKPDTQILAYYKGSLLMATKHRVYYGTVDKSGHWSDKNVSFPLTDPPLAAAVIDM